MDAREQTTETERRRGTVLFVDITGFTALNQELGAEKSYEIISGFLKLLDGIARKHGGNVDKYLGDCVMATFGVPFAMENAPRAAVNAAIDMHNHVEDYNREQGIDPPLGVHTGIETGLMISGDVSGPVLREFSVMGNCVNISARLKDLAPTGSIWVGRDTHRATREQFEFNPADTLKLKGIKDPYPAYEVTSRDVQIHRQRRTEKTQIYSPLVGRGQELTELRSYAAALAAGKGGIVSIVGDAGTGKSRLAAELANVGELVDAQWIDAPSLDVGVRRGFYPFGELLRSWLGAADRDDASTLEALKQELSTLFGENEDELFPFIANLMSLPLRRREQKRIEDVDGEALEKLILRAMSELIPRIAGEAPLVFFFEDFHWADGSSVSLLQPLLRLAERNPVLFLLTVRPEFPAAAEFLAASREQYTDRHREIHLGPLDQGAAEEMLENIFEKGNVSVAMRSLIEEKAAGNPFYIEEVVRSLIDQGAVAWRESALFTTERIEDVEIPGSIQEVVMTRIDQLPLPTKRVLGIAAVIGQTSDPEVLASIVDDEDFEAHLETLIAAQFLTRRRRRTSIEIAFRHPLTQVVSYDSLLEARRKELHLEVGEAIEDILPESTPGLAGMLAYHFGLGEDQRAEPYLLQAGDEAARVAASSEALFFFREASKLYLERLGESANPEIRSTLEKKIAVAYLNRGQFIEAIDHFDKALALLGVNENRSKLGNALHLTRAFITVFSSIYLPGMRRSRGEASERERDVFELRIDRARIQVTADPGRFLPDCLSGLHELRRVDHSSIEKLGWLYAAAGGLFSYAGILFGVSARFLDRGHEAINRDDERELFFLGLMSFVHHLLSGDWDEAHEVDPALVAEALRHGQLWDVATYAGLEENKLVHQGRFREASQDLELLMKMQDLYAYDYARSTGLFSTALLRLEQGRLEEALTTAEEYVTSFDEPALNILGLGTKAQIQVRAGDFEGAYETLEREAALHESAGTLVPFHGNPAIRARFELDVAELEAAVREEHSTDVRSLRRRAARSGGHARRVAGRVAWDRAPIYRTTGLAHWYSGSHTKALTWWGKAAEAAEKLGMKPELARICRDIGRHLGEAGSGPDAFEGQNGEAWLEKAAAISRELETTLNPATDAEPAPD